MQTPWGELPVSDAHVHFFSHHFFTTLGKQKGDLGAEDVIRIAGCEPPPADPVLLGRRWVEELDQATVASAVLIASVPGDEDSVAAAVSKFPDRLYGYFLLNPLALDVADRIEAAFRRGLRGICLFPAMHAYSVHDDRVRAVFDAAAAHPGTIVFVHCGVLSVGIRKKLGLASPFDMRYSNPTDLHGIALRYPKIPFVIPHFGAGYFREALMLADLCPNVYLDTSSTNGWLRYQPHPLTLANVFERALAVAGPGRLLFGTDSSFFPRGWNTSVFHAQVSALQDIGIPPDVAGAILGGNLRGLLQAG
jgi:uncharacterized protein